MGIWLGMGIPTPLFETTKAGSTHLTGMLSVFLFSFRVNEPFSAMVHIGHRALPASLLRSNLFYQFEFIASRFNLK